MARKDVLAGALASIGKPESAPRTGKGILHTGALGAIDASLSRSLQLTELDPAQILDSEFADRLPWGEAELADLIHSIRENGQQIPILVHREAANQYRVVYGRRRLAAVRHLGLKVRALVAQMDDAGRIIAQGIENTVRTDLSFIEKAMFAHRLREGGVDEATIRQALNVDVDAPKATTISTMKMVVEALGEELILAIGRAPGVGRPRWRLLAEAIKSDLSEFTAANREALTDHLREYEDHFATGDAGSDQRFAAALDWVERSAVNLSRIEPDHGSQVPEGMEIQRNGRRLAFVIRRTDNPAFHAWLNAKAEELAKELHQRWLEECNTQQEKEAR